MCFASAYQLRFRLLPHARRLSVLTTTLRPPMPVGGSFHDAFALRFYSHETWQHPPYLWTNVRTNRHCISTEIARMQLAQVTNKTEIRLLNTSALSLTRCARWSKSYGPSWRTSCRRRGCTECRRLVRAWRPVRNIYRANVFL